MPKPRHALARQFKTAIRTAGDITLNSASLADVPSVTDITLAAEVGDVLEYILNGMYDAGGAVETYFDVATIVSAAPVNYFSSGSSTPAAGGVGGWATDGAGTRYITGSAFYTVQSADLAAGFVTLRLRYDQNSAVSRSLRAASTRPLQWAAKNLGPPDPN